jgi:hypothetical protein
MRWIACTLLIVLVGVVSLAIKSGLEADNYISSCLDDSSPSYILDKDVRRTMCKQPNR